MELRWPQLMPINNIVQKRSGRFQGTEVSITDQVKVEESHSMSLGLLLGW